MLESRLSSTYCRRQVRSRFNQEMRIVTKIMQRVVDLGKAANFPYATINPEGEL